MPELPDVETFRRYFDAHGLRRKIARVEVVNAKVLQGLSVSRLAAALKEKSFTRTDRHGKYLFAFTGKSGGVLVMHFGMTGFLEAYGDDQSPPTHARVVFHFTNGKHLAFVDQRMFGRITWATSVKQFVQAKKLGPDALTADLAATLEGRRGAVKTVLMDQASAAGIGNVYADEILFQSRIHPQQPAETLTEKERETIARAARSVLKTAIDKNADPERFPETYLIPRRKKGAACPRCGGKVASVQVGGRTTYFCPRCQKR